MNETDCREITLDNVVRIDIVPNKYLGVAVPTSVPLQSVNTSLPFAPTFSMAYSMLGYAAERDIAEDYSEIDRTQAKISLKSTKSTSQLGALYSYDLQVTGLVGLPDHIASAIHAERELEGENASVILRFEDGSRKLLYFLPNTFTFAVEQATSESSTQATVKVAGKSVSNLIDIIIKQ